ncbi:MAG: SAM-dependent methyltransferase [Anaerolinea sp.]|nr:SAM-dependent methyltransferase [Anaerolinea sp.]
MMNPVFGKEYADQYDLLYGDKDYEAECDLLEKVFELYGSGSIKTILDLGCGTGNHAIPLTRRGYLVTGVDRSEDMLVHTRHKAASDLQDATREPPTFLQGDVRSLDLGEQFDAVLMMFAVLGYQLSNEDVAAALQTIRRHLKPGGLFVFDVWYGPAVLAIRPGDRVKVIPIDNGQVIRAASGSLDISRHLAEVRYHVWRVKGKQVVSESEEIHQMRYFFPMELAFYLHQVGLEVKGLTAFPSLDRPADETTWNVLGVAKVL